MLISFFLSVLYPSSDLISSTFQTDHRYDPYALFPPSLSPHHFLDCHNKPPRWVFCLHFYLPRECSSHIRQGYLLKIVNQVVSLPCSKFFSGFHHIWSTGLCPTYRVLGWSGLSPPPSCWSSHTGLLAVWHTHQAQVQFLGFCTCWFFLIWDLCTFGSPTRQRGYVTDGSKRGINCSVSQQTVCIHGTCLTDALCLIMRQLEKYNLEISSHCLGFYYLGDCCMTLNQTHLRPLGEDCLGSCDIKQAMASPQREFIITPLTNQIRPFRLLSYLTKIPLSTLSSPSSWGVLGRLTELTLAWYDFPLPGEL